MPYQPQEGIDYIVDFYAVSNVDPEADASEIKKAINKQLSQYHPDRLEGLAPEFQARGQRMAQLLNKARGILENPANRAEYDDIRTSWAGPISTDGSPAITIGRAQQAEMATKSAEEVAAIFTGNDQDIDKLANYNAGLIDFFEHMITSAGDNVSAELRQQYESALLEYDRNLAIKEAQRGSLLGLPDLSHSQYRASLEYSAQVNTAIETAQTKEMEDLQSIAMGKTARRLAILSGETPSTEIVDPATVQLPVYYETVADQVRDIAETRQSVTEKRLENLHPTYPEADLQKEKLASVIIGLQTDNDTHWFTFKVDADAGSIDETGTSPEVKKLLSQGEFKTVIGQGNNVLSIPIIEQLSLKDVLDEAVNKYIAQYYPEMLG